jgi:hypothetical protein
MDFLDWSKNIMEAFVITTWCVQISCNFVKSDDSYAYLQNAHDSSTFMQVVDDLSKEPTKDQLI